ncbi:glucan ABC transporter ATP-binding protein/ permease [Limobrevibacterium gyesilva]|uniref:Glucan ABC transporter ATP-binding protein/ permease n=1 Tax=Limobrevibacterium gyesilva TaxID=2991712 RepID=A0AA41YQ44_9PROT|nr:glucan ABC transporter ATP-binding protein/ permease [Limobrevibacterium gyesilva]MCW3477624.1 glucan ABC transporter ATP-binding protein/ permease [Limobrevibacterium gyesilva]
MRLLRVYGRVIGTLGRDLRIAILLTVANLVVAGLQFVDPVLFGRVIEMLSHSDTTPPDALWTQAVQLLGLWAAVGVAGIVANIAAALQAERLAHRNRLMAMRRFYEHVLWLPLSFHGVAHSGRLMKIMLSGADAMFWLWLSFFRDQLSTFVATLVLLPLTMFLNWRLAVSLMVLVVLFCVLTALVIRHTEAGQQRAQHWQMALAGTAQDALANVTVVQSFTRLAAETRLFGEIMDKVIANQFPVLNWWALVNVMTRAASTIAVISIVVIGTVLHVRGQASVGEIVSFMGLAMLLIGRLDGAMSFAARLFMEVPGLEEFFKVLDTTSSVPEKPNAVALVPGPGEVVFEDVGFAYPGGPPVLQGVSFTARPGTTVALVGRTGAGKSTVMALLQRMWDPTEGRILIDGQDLRDVTLESLRRGIGVVFQEAMLLNRTIRENLLIGKPDATEAELDRATRMADAHEFIIRQPLGYDTVVGERGTTLSGGQRQRLAIARALLKDPPILILDEATSALDAATEARVSRALKTLMSGRTTFIIAHRLSTVRDADEILVFDAGQIVEQGSFEALLQRHDRFAELVATQLAPVPAE